MFPPQKNLAREILIRRGTGRWRLSTRTADAYEVEIPFIYGGSREDALEILRLEAGIAELELDDVHPAADEGNLDDFIAEMFAEAFDFLDFYVWGDMRCQAAGVSFAETALLRHILPPRLAQFYGHDLLNTFRVSLNIVAAKLALYLSEEENPYLASTAEELAALALIREVKSLIADAIQERENALGAAVLDDDGGQLQDAFDVVSDMTFDILEKPHAGVLFEDICATIDDLDNPLLFAFGPCLLHPNDWFVPFDEDINGLYLVNHALGEEAVDVLTRGMQERMGATYGEEGTTDEPGLLDGLLTCAECGGEMMLVGDEYVCTGDPVMQ